MNVGIAHRLKTEFGDFQTPPELSKAICNLLYARGVNPLSILEPTCGKGSFLLSALDQFPSVSRAIGIDINPRYVQHAERELARRQYTHRSAVFQGNFFETAWSAILDDLPGRILVIGNPPWVTNSTLSSLRSSNLPEKTNFKKHSGLDAITGKSNFDISEWMLIRMLEWADGRNLTLAMLCKTAVARKALVHAWTSGKKLNSASIYRIDAKKHFNADVDACLLVCEITNEKRDNQICRFHVDLSDDSYEKTFGLIGSRLVADAISYERWKHLDGESGCRWRSGIKHDCSSVMEFTKVGNAYRNGLGELNNLEDAYMFPMLKSSDIAKGDVSPSRWMLVPQRSIGGETESISYVAPGTWAYLNSHSNIIDMRRSSIYRNRPRYSVFGVGEYSFADWKVAISSLYKRLHFAVVGPYEGKPVVLDDTCYFIPCQNQWQAQQFASLLNSAVATEFLNSLIFWDAKRPITVDVLKRLDLLALARELGVEYMDTVLSSTAEHVQLPLFG
ncbi:MAG: SAM-dependent methyltransferase [Chloroflexi bacterium]|nr:SAM-dependent methyltransferase [Chloroflexota bacterium]